MIEESVEYRTKMLNDLEDCNQRLHALVEDLAPAFGSSIRSLSIA
jgi:hypothetical protein